MKTKLLIIVSRLLHGGIDTLLIEYLNHIDKSKFQVSLGIGICMEELEMHIQNVPTDVKVEYLVKNHYLVSFRKKKVKKKLHLCSKLLDEMILNPIRRSVQHRNLQRLIKQNDVIIDFDSSFYSFLKNCPIRKIAFFHFSFRQYYNGNQAKLLRLGKKMEVYDQIVTTCNDMKKEGEELFPEIKEKFITVYNSFNFDLIRLKASQPLQTEWSAEPYILAIQRLEESQKDTLTLLKAFKIVSDRYEIPHKLHIIGEGKDRKMLESFSSSLGLSEKVIFHGFQSNPYPRIKNCELFVLSSKFEGFGNVLVEAMILEKPIISTDCPIGPSEILDYGKAGILVPIGDTNSLAEAIHTLLTDSALKAHILEACRVQVEKFNSKKNIKKIEDLIIKSLP